MADRGYINRSIRGFLLVFIVVTVLQIVFFGVTFTTFFNLGILIFLTFFTIVNVIYSRQRYIAFKNLRYILMFCLILFFCSFIIIEVIVSTELKSTIDMNQDVDYVIILGAGLNGDKVSMRLEGRLQKGLEYLKEKTTVKVIVSGGQGKDELISEAEAMGRYLISRGIDDNRIVYEDKSTSTIENIYFSKRIINDISNKKDIKVLIVTSDYHMFRAKMIGSKLGLQSFGISSESPSGTRINYLIREYFTVIKDWIYLGLYKINIGISATKVK